jgi:hypothetical protein
MNSMDETGDLGTISAMNMRIAFAGPRDLGARSELFAQRLDEVYRSVAAVAGRIAATPTNTKPGETVLKAHEDALPTCGKGLCLTLLTGFAGGADRIAAQSWRRLELGKLHAVFPFRNQTDGKTGDGTGFAWTDGPGNRDITYRVDLSSPEGLDGGFDKFTVLDGTASAKEIPPRHGHLEQTRFLARWADLAIVAWTGEAAAGPGGTADLVALCLAKRTPVIWINLKEPDMPVRQVFAGEFWPDVHFGEFLYSLKEQEGLAASAPVLTTGDLQCVLLPQFMRPAIAPQHQDIRELCEGGHGHNKAELDPPEHKKGGSEPQEHDEPDIYDRYITDKDPQLKQGRFLAKICKELWSLIYKHPGCVATSTKTNAGAAAEPFAPRIHPLIAAAFDKADKKALTIGDAHRGTQILILIVAPIAVFLATMPAIHPAGKIWYVTLELGLIIVAYYQHSILVKNASHHYWSDVRRLAERLRVLRATWPLAFDVADGRADPPETWTEWLARVVRRAAGPPTGVLDIDSKRNAILFAQQDRDGIVHNQINYQNLTALRAGVLHHRLHRLEVITFGLLVTLLVIFVCWYLSGLLIAGWSKPPAVLGSIVMIASAVIPVIAAICLAIEAKFDLGESSTKAMGLGKQFLRVSNGITREHNQSRDEELLREAALILLNDVDQWQEGALRRAPGMI